MMGYETLTVTIQMLFPKRYPVFNAVILGVLTNRRRSRRRIAKGLGKVERCHPILTEIFTVRKFFV